MLKIGAVAGNGGGDKEGEDEKVAAEAVTASDENSKVSHS